MTLGIALFAFIAEGKHSTPYFNRAGVNAGFARVLI